MGRVNAGALFSSPFGGQITRTVSTVFPLGPESGFSPGRDIRNIYGGIYALQGADFVTVLEGTFNVAAIEQAAQARADAVDSSAPAVATPYAGYTIYTVSNMGIVMLGPTLMLSGTETGLRRALDRLRYGMLSEDDVPGWMARGARRRQRRLRLRRETCAGKVCSARRASACPSSTASRSCAATATFKRPG